MLGEKEAWKLKISKRKRLIFVGTIPLLFIAALAFALYSPTKNEVQYRTDIKPVSNRIPNLKNIQKVYWSAKIFNDNFGPTAYWMRGYVFLNHVSIQDLKASYTWETVSLKPKIEYDFNGKAQKWSYSEEFNSFMMGSKYVISKIYLDLNSGTLYFEIEK